MVHNLTQMNKLVDGDAQTVLVSKCGQFILMHFEVFFFAWRFSDPLKRLRMRLCAARFLKRFHFFD